MTIVLNEHLIVQQETIKASEFKAKCLQLMDEVKATGKEIIITKNGEPVSKLVPIKKRPKTLFGAHKKVVKIYGDIISPLDEEWEAMK
jgi:prevent-host-death family protein